MCPEISAQQIFQQIRGVHVYFLGVNRPASGCNDMTCCSAKIIGSSVDVSPSWSSLQSISEHCTAESKLLAGLCDMTSSVVENKGVTDMGVFVALTPAGHADVSFGTSEITGVQDKAKGVISFWDGVVIGVGLKSKEQYRDSVQRTIRTKHGNLSRPGYERKMKE